MSEPPPPPPLGIDDGVVLADPLWARECRAALSDAPRAVKVLSPCAGLNSPERAAREMGLSWETAGDWDVNPALRSTLLRLSRKPELLHVGPRTGDVLSVDIGSLDLSTDGIVAGPPCPPFSSIGKRLAELDSRSSVFVTVCAWILHLSTNGHLCFFILENVAGITSKRKGDDQSFADWFMEEMYKDLPQGWSIRVVRHNSSKCLLPQSRPRVFFVGTSAALTSGRRLRRISSQPPLSWPAVDLLEFLDPVPKEEDWASLSVRQQVNLMTNLEQFHKQCSENPDKEQVAITDVARDPLKRFDSGLVVGCTRTLRTNSAYLWILPSPACTGKFGEKGRFLNRAEKARCAGLRPESLQDLSDPECDKAIGNTIPVPLIGTVMFPVLRAWVEHEVMLQEEACAAASANCQKGGATKHHHHHHRRHHHHGHPIVWLSITMHRRMQGDAT